MTAPQGPEAEYLDALRAGRFLFQRRRDGTAVFPPRVMAPGDGGPLEWFESAGRGQIHAVTTQHRRPPAAAVHIALVEMDEGFRLLSRIDSATAPAIGDRVVARIVTDDVPHVSFVPV